jgi:Putative zinc-finger
MSRPALPGQHLSDEAIAAYADSMLSAVPRERAQRHVQGCPECAHAVSVQREAVLALRTAPLPLLPSGLLERLRALPITTPLPVPSVTLDPTGAAVFPAHGTPTPTAPGAPVAPAAPLPPQSQQQAATQPSRRRVPFGIFTAAVVALGAGLAAAAGSHAAAQPVAPARVLPPGYTSADVNSGTTMVVHTALPLPPAR